MARRQERRIVTSQPDLADVQAAGRRIAPHVHHTPVATSHLLDEWLGVRAHLKTENLQRIGAFKVRGAMNAVALLDADRASGGVAAHSSGNHAAALALAARTRGIAAHIVMPENAPGVKKAAVSGYGAAITECAPDAASRDAAVAAVIEATGAVEIHPFDNDDIIAGAGTAALELLSQVDGLDVVVAPIGGGGLISGTAIAAHGLDPRIRVIGAEPLAVDDAARSLASGVLQPPPAPVTIADGLRTGLRPRTFAIISDHVEDIVTVTEEEIVEAMRFVWMRVKLIIEPSAAVAVAAVRKTALDGAVVGIIVSGGNVDLDALPWMRTAGTDGR